jgi:hypothetical protein
MLVSPSYNKDVKVKIKVFCPIHESIQGRSSIVFEERTEPRILYLDSR